MDKLTTRLSMRLLAGGETPIHLKVECHYSAADPFAVHINFGCVGGLHEAVWVASRELLMAGLKAPTGHGDLLIGPWDHAYSYIALTGDTDTALLHIRTRELTDFLAATAQIVPVGAESARIDWEPWIGDVLSA
ncbi:SsgA family sporulation/cell division regulator [Actinacidiphila glaucinigra]|uniref:SsgA family sporulation/cell division regulator n=1 Tax=Actinacidiphila glaucinigra TaxID=235986 RepID=UPI0036E22E37